MTPSDVPAADSLVLKQLLPEEVRDIFVAWGLRPYRAVQVMKWIYGRQSLDFHDMTDLSKRDRDLLSRRCTIGQLSLLERKVSTDGTQKWALGLEDGHRIETVIIPEDGHLTQCVSTQVGCSMGCKFCRTSYFPVRRNLKAWEIIEQVVMARRLIKTPLIRNVVLMGMGEPLANYDEVIKAIKIMLDPICLDISKRRITLSTCGLIPEMQRLASEGLGISLAISLNATTNEQRNLIMPINRKYPLELLLEACRNLPLPSRSRVTLEYVLLKDFNDSQEDALRLVSLIKGIRCKVNLIPHNPFPGSPFERPPQERILAFQRVLAQAGITSPIRWSRGQDIEAACGQLACVDQGLSIPAREQGGT